MTIPESSYAKYSPFRLYAFTDASALPIAS